MKKTQSNYRGLEQLNLLMPETLEVAGKWYRKLNLLNSLCEHIDQRVHDALCKGYQPGEVGRLRIYASAEDRDREYSFLKEKTRTNPRMSEIEIANITFYGLETTWLESVKPILKELATG